MPPDRSRRQLLRAGLLGVGGLLAGCLGSDDAPGEGTDPTTGETETATAGTPARTTAREPPTLAVGETVPVGDAEVTIASMAVKRFLIARSSGRPAIRSDAGRKYLIAVSKYDQSPYPVDRLRLRVDDTVYEVEPEEAYREKEDIYRFVGVFALPAELTADEAVVYALTPEDEPLAYWRVPETTIERLNDPPVVEVQSVSVPESVAIDETISVTFELRNSGPVDGTFAYAVGRAGLSHLRPLTTTVPAGETLTYEDGITIARKEEDSVEIEIDYGRDRRSYTVDVVPATTSG